MIDIRGNFIKRDCRSGIWLEPEVPSLGGRWGRGR